MYLRQKKKHNIQNAIPHKKYKTSSWSKRIIADDPDVEFIDLSFFNETLFLRQKLKSNEEEIITLLVFTRNETEQLYNALSDLIEKSK